MTEHTAGPWTYDYAPEPGHASEFMVLGPRNAVLAYVGADEARDVTGPTVEANARLIAQAPALAAENQKLREALWKVKEILWPQRDFASHHSELCDHQLAVNDALAVVMAEFGAAPLLEGEGASK